MQPWAAEQTFSRFSEYQVESMLTGIQLVALQDLERWEVECRVPHQVLHVQVEEGLQFTFTHKLLLWSVDMYWTRLFN